MRCAFAYRYFLSLHEFLGFKYVGHKSIKLAVEEVLEEFSHKYEAYFRFRQETKYYAETKLKYVDDSLVL